MVLIQVLLPTETPGGQRVKPELFALTRRELTDAFGGSTAYLRSPAQGLWTDPGGGLEHDRVVMVEVVAARFDRAWWQPYARTLAARFEQKTIHVRALPADLLDPDAA